jgi:hypothetical protein
MGLSSKNVFKKYSLQQKGKQTAEPKLGKQNKKNAGVELLRKKCNR